MIELTSVAERHVDDLLTHFAGKRRPEAIENLSIALRRALHRIETNPEHGLPAPRPYPALSELKLRWIKEGSYWFAYTEANPPVIAGVYYAAADLPRRA